MGWLTAGTTHGRSSEFRLQTTSYILEQLGHLCLLLVGCCFYVVVRHQPPIENGRRQLFQLYASFGLVSRDRGNCAGRLSRFLSPVVDHLRHSSRGATRHASESVNLRQVVPEWSHLIPLRGRHGLDGRPWRGWTHLLQWSVVLSIQRLHLIDVALYPSTLYIGHFINVERSTVTIAENLLKAVVSADQHVTISIFRINGIEIRVTRLVDSVKYDVCLQPFYGRGFFHVTIAYQFVGSNLQSLLFVNRFGYHYGTRQPQQHYIR